MYTNILATICDLDGIIIRTETIHAQAWKKVLDIFFSHHRETFAKDYGEFDINPNYAKYFANRSNLEGIQAYFEALNIPVSGGTLEDPEEKNTLLGLCNLKDSFFTHLSASQDIEIIDENVQQLKEWKQQGMKIVVVSYNKNCQNILKIAKISSLFNLIVNGFVAEKHQLRPKPHPDAYLYAATSLGIAPEAIMIVENDALGLEAAKSGGFGLTVCLQDQNNSASTLTPDIWANSLSEIQWAEKNAYFKQKRPVFELL